MVGTSSSSSALPLRPALRMDSEDAPSPKGSAKVVSIAEPGPDDMTELPPPAIEDSQSVKQYTAGLAKRLTGRLSIQPISSKNTTKSQASSDELHSAKDVSTHQSRAHRRRHHEHLLNQVSEWLEGEKTKRAARKLKRSTRKSKDEAFRGDEFLVGSPLSRNRTYSDSSDSSTISLEKLQRILAQSMVPQKRERQSPVIPMLGGRRPSSTHIRRRPSLKHLRGFVSSDTEYLEGDAVVPSCDAVLDNSKTVVSSSADLSSLKRSEKDREAWVTFKNEIVRLAHTLRLKGWRRVPLDRGCDIKVQRLSGALTNAVYVVSPPKDLPEPIPTPTLNPNDMPSKSRGPRQPPKLLLRIYGPQVEHLIDRDNELGILRRLARKKIGPRLLGTFKNGRFEEFFDAQTLNAKDLRVPETSKQIAKRMRELHDGIDLLPREREEGPFVWQNWDKWVDRCEQIISYLDKKVKDTDGTKAAVEPWEKKGFVCGVEWPVFRKTVERYREWLEHHYGGAELLNKKLVFAHNDTQYGNILRINPPAPTDGSAPSPLLLPANEHKQLIVIDFEYASANVAGLEFANHFAEWCYNYHDPVKSWQCNTSKYPTLEEQKRFLRAYVNHRPQFHPAASATPKMDGKEAAPGSISAFMLDSRSPSGSVPTAQKSYAEEEAWRQMDLDRQLEEYMQDVRIWRLANSAQWVAWGIVQAQIPDLDPAHITDSSTTASPTEVSAEPTLQQANDHASGSSAKMPGTLVAEAHKDGETAKEAEVEGNDQPDEFDYLSYAQDRAMFFWGDAVSLGFVKKEELPAVVQQRLKTVDH